MFFSSITRTIIYRYPTRVIPDNDTKITFHDLYFFKQSSEYFCFQ